MTPHRQSTLSNLRIRLRAVAVGLIVVGAAIFFSVGTPAEAKDRPYLALGDSVVFGYITLAGFEYVNQQLRRVPELRRRGAALDAANAACPGRQPAASSHHPAPTTAAGLPGSFPLHVAYTSTQLDFATRFLQANPSTRLVTIGLGANDLFFCRRLALATRVHRDRAPPGVGHDQVEHGHDPQ